MPIVAAILGLAAIVWGAVYARRGSVITGCALLLVVAYVFGHEFWNGNIGPLPLTLDRLVLLGLLAAGAVQWRIGALRLRSLTSADWALMALLGVLLASAAISGQPDFSDGITSKWGRLLASFLLPATLYFIVRQLVLSRRDWFWLLGSLVTLGAYLTATGIFEVAGVWALVYPRHITDPGLGIHFGRARGPELNSVSLGMQLTAAILCGWMMLRQAPARWQQLLLLVVLPLMALTVFFAYTRSTWLGLAASAILVAALEIPRRWRLPALSAGAVAGLIVVIASWSQLLGLSREGTAAESEHSVNQRKSFAYVSSQMFRDYPIFGVGFGRFHDQKLPYLSDRSQSFELESIRPLHHHNTLLSLLTETGLVGFAAFTAVLCVWARCGYRMTRSRTAATWRRAQGVLMLALLTNYLCSAVFHDLTLIPSQHLLLFAVAGVTVNLRQMEVAVVNEGVRSTTAHSA
jgi:O-antigen ligase